MLFRSPISSLISLLSHIMGNGAKAQQKRDRNNEKAAKGGKSQLKGNEAAKNIACKTCFQTFLSTSRGPELEQHAANKHSKTLAECFPAFST